MISDTLILFRSELRRFIRSRVFRIDAAVSLGFLILMIITEAGLAAAGKGIEGVSFAAVAIGMIFVLPVFPAIIIPMITGSEFEYGTVRNKLTAGHSRMSVYFGGLLADFAAVFAYIAAVTVIDITGLKIFVSGTESAFKLLQVLLYAVLFEIIILLPAVTLSYAAVMIFGNKNHAANFCLIAAFIIFIVSVAVFVAVVPTEVGAVSASGFTSISDMSGFRHDLYVILNYTLPLCQIIKVLNLLSASDGGNINTELTTALVQTAVINTAVSAAATALGAAVFGRKNIK